MKNNRIISIDILKIFSIFLIIAFHFIYNIGITNTRWIGFIGVSLFFIISGFTFSKKYPNLKKISLKWFLKRYIKIALIYYPALILLAIFLGRQIYNGNVFFNLLSHFFFVDFLFPQYNYAFISPAWFLTPLIALYLLYPYLNRYVSRFSMFLLITFVLMTLFRIYTGTLTSFNPIFFIGEFCFGIAFAKGRKSEAMIISLITIFANIMMVVPFILFYLATKINWNIIPKKPIIFLSCNTLILFIFHESFIKIGIGKWHITSFTSFISILILSIIVVLVYMFSNKINFLINKKLKIN